MALTTKSVIGPARGVYLSEALGGLQLQHLYDLFAMKGIYPVAIDVDTSANPTLPVQAATSWYGEALNTATRGSRQELPAVKIVVAEATKVTIFDGDDPSLPMWRVWDFTGYTITSVRYVNGRIFVGTMSGVVVLDFAADEVSVALKYSMATTPAIVSNTVNSIATHVAPDASIDAVSGLPVATVATGTEGNGTYLASLLQHDGNVFHIGADGGNTCVDLDFREDGSLVLVRSDGAVYIWHDPFSIAANGAVPDETITDNILGVTASVSNRALGSVDGLTLTPNPDLYAHATTDYATPLMFGDCKLAALCEASDADLVGQEVLNSEFTGTGNLDGWTLEATAINNNVVDVINLTSGPATNEVALKTITGLEIGALYRVDFKRQATPSPSQIVVGPAASGYESVSGVRSMEFVATATSHGAIIYSSGANVPASFDYIRINKVTPDRSGNGNGLIINNTVPVNDGWVGPFSAANYLEQPYNADLDFGTGDFYVACKVRWGTGAQYGAAVHRTTTKIQNTDQSFAIYSGGLTVNAKVLGTIVQFEASSEENTERHYTLVRKGGVLFAYTDAVLVDTAEEAGDLDLPGATSFIGGHNIGTPGMVETNQLYLKDLIIGAGAPSPEQIKIMALWKGDPLPGTSSAVLDTDFDSSTSLLWVLTSDKICAFGPQGAEVTNKQKDNTNNATRIHAEKGNVVWG